MHNLKPFKKKSAQKQRSAKGRSNANKHWIRRLISASLVGMLLILGCVGCRPGNMMCRSRARSDDWFDDDDDYFTEWEETTERLVLGVSEIKRCRPNVHLDLLDLRILA